MELQLNIKHVKKEDHTILDAFAAARPELVEKKNDGYRINEIGLQTLKGLGSEGLAFVTHYGLMGGYSAIELGGSAPVMADFDIY